MTLIFKILKHEIIACDIYRSYLLWQILCWDYLSIFRKNITSHYFFSFFISNTEVNLYVWIEDRPNSFHSKTHAFSDPPFSSYQAWVIYQAFNLLQYNSHTTLCEIHSKSLRKNAYNIVLCFQHNFKSSLITWNIKN